VVLLWRRLREGRRRTPLLLLVLLLLLLLTLLKCCSRSRITARRISSPVTPASVSRRARRPERGVGAPPAGHFLQLFLFGPASLLVPFLPLRRGEQVFVWIFLNFEFLGLSSFPSSLFFPFLVLPFSPPLLHDFSFVPARLQRVCVGWPPLQRV
jgi:hypothetical protein